jgi:type IV secretory pathway VirB9-like protein
MKALFCTTFLAALCYAQVPRPVTNTLTSSQRNSVDVPAVRPQVVGRAVQEGQVTTVYLAPRFATVIRMPDAVNSVVVGDPDSFSAEHSEKEPALVFVKPITLKAAQTNLLISTAHGYQANLLLA